MNDAALAAVVIAHHRLRIEKQGGACDEQVHRNYWSIDGNRPRRADFAAAIAFLAGERAAFITGQTLFGMEAQAWAISRTRNWRNEFLDCTSKPFSDCLQMVRSLNPEIAKTI